MAFMNSPSQGVALRAAPHLAEARAPGGPRDLFLRGRQLWRCAGTPVFDHATRPGRAGRGLDWGRMGGWMGWMGWRILETMVGWHPVEIQIVHDSTIFCSIDCHGMIWMQDQWMFKVQTGRFSGLEHPG